MKKSLEHRQAPTSDRSQDRKEAHEVKELIVLVAFPPAPTTEKVEGRKEGPNNINGVRHANVKSSQVIGNRIELLGSADV